MASRRQAAQQQTLPLRDRVLPVEPIGVTGLKRYAGYIQDEWHTALTGKRALKVYREMRDNDAICGAMQWAMECQIRQAPKSVKPAGDQPIEQFYADHVASCLDDMSHTWQEFLSEVLTCYWAGFALHEIVYKIRRGPTAPLASLKSRHDDGLVGWRKLSPRAQETIDRWDFDDDGGIRGAVQIAPPDYRTRELPIERALLFRVVANRGSPEGRSMYRNSYRSWWFLKRIQELEAIGVERDMAGMLVIRVPPEYLLTNATADQKATVEAFRKVAERARRGEYDSLVFPTDADLRGRTGFDVSLLQSGGRRPMDSDGIIKRLESRIAIPMLGDQVLLGAQGQAGSGASWSLHSGKTHLLALALKAVMDSIAGVFNNFGIPRLMLANGWPVAASPSFEFGDIETDDSGAFASDVASLLGSGGLTTGRALEEYLRRRLGIPEEEAIDLRSGRVQDALGRLAEQPDGADYAEAQAALQQTVPIPGEAPVPDLEAEAGGGSGVSVTVPEELTADGETAVPTVSLNGAQISSLLAVMREVAEGTLPYENGLEVIMTAFQLDRAKAERLLTGMGRPEAAATLA